MTQPLPNPDERSGRHLARGHVRLGVALLLLIGHAGALAAPPAPGAIQQETLPAPLPLAPPGELLTLPSSPEASGDTQVAIPLTRLLIEGNQLIPSSALEPLLTGLAGRTVTLAELNQAAQRITDHYRSKGQLLAYAYLPAQTIRDGVVTLRVVEPRYDRIAILGDARLAPTQALRTLGLAPSEPIARAPLERGLLLLDQTPGIRVAGTLVPGAEPGTSGLEVTLHDGALVSGSLGADNFGSDSVGRLRSFADLALANPLGYGSRLALNGLTSEGGLLRAGGFALLTPDLYQGLRLNLFGSTTRYRLGGEFRALDQQGEADQWGASLGYPLRLRPREQVNLRAELKRNRYAQRNSLLGLDQRSHLDLARLALDGSLARPRGDTLAASLALTHGELLLDSADARSADAAGPNAAGRFYSAQFSLRHALPLPQGLSLTSALSGQWASRNLDSSQGFYLGGPNAVRAYPGSDLGGDDGLLLQLTLARPLDLGLPGAWLGRLYADYGQVRIRHDAATASGPNRAQIAGAGLGLDYHLGARLSLTLDYAQRLGPTPVQADPADHAYLWGRLVLSL